MQNPLIDADLYNLLKKITQVTSLLNDGQAGNPGLIIEREALLAEAQRRGFPLTEDTIRRVEERLRAEEESR